MLGRVLCLRWARGPSTTAKACWGPSAAARTDLGSCCLGNCRDGNWELQKK